MTLSAATKILMFIVAIFATLHFVSLAYVSASFITIIKTGSVMTFGWVLFYIMCTED